MASKKKVIRLEKPEVRPDGTKIRARLEDGTPCCGHMLKRRPGEDPNSERRYCSNHIGLNQYGACNIHPCGGGKGKGALPKKEWLALRSRDAVLDYIVNKHETGLKPHIDVIDDSAIKDKNVEEAKWIVSMAVGGPKSIIENVFSSKEIMDAVIDILDEEFPDDEERFNACVRKLKQRLEGLASTISRSGRARDASKEG